MGVTIGFVKNTAQIIVFAFLTLCDLPEIHRAGPLSLVRLCSVVDEELVEENTVHQIGSICILGIGNSLELHLFS